jgi:hypothetical protein
VLAGDADALPGETRAGLEDAIGAFADIRHGDARQLLVAHGQSEHQDAAGAALRTEAEPDEIVPVEGRYEEGGRYAAFGEQMVRLALGIEMRDLVFLLQRRHAVVV